MEKTDVLIIGGGAAGIFTGRTGKLNYPEKDFLIIRLEKQILIPCAIPYLFGTLGSVEKDVIPDSLLEKAGVRLKIDEVISIDKEKKVCKTANGDEIQFEKLVLATGSFPAVPKWLKGTNLENVFTVVKDKEKLSQMLQKLKDCEKIVIVGGGFIGVEVADDLSKLKKDITIVEILPHVLMLVFDEEVAEKAEEVLKSNGIKVKTGVGIKEILGKEKVEGVLLQNGEKVEADAVILAMGYKPNTRLAEEAGIELNEFGFIKVDEYMRTSAPDVYAVGDCAEKKNFLTGKPTKVMLASIACAEARIVGMNLYGLNTIKSFNGTIGIFSTKIGNTGFGAAGLSENAAKKEGIDVVTGSFKGVDRHPGCLPGAHEQFVKLIVCKDSGLIIGGEVIGGESTGELINLIGFAIQNRMTVRSILTSQIGTHPLLTSAPTVYPIIKAAEDALKKCR